ncbi:MAG: C40 family peptidase [Burkholderia sp.]
MLRIWLSVVVIFLLAACSTAPQQSSTRTDAAPRITMPRGFPSFVDHSIGREEIPIQAMSLVGVPYRWGGNTPDSGFDCSGLVRYIVSRAANVSLPRTTAEMSTRGESIEPDEIAPGDLVFFNTTGRPHSHVGIYVGKFRFVNAPSTGGTVRLNYLTDPYWAKHFDGIRRVVPAGHAPTPFDTPTYEADNHQPDPVPMPQATPAAAPVYAATYAESTPACIASALAQAAVPAALGVTATTAAAGEDQFEPRCQPAQQQARAAGTTTAAVTPRAASSRAAATTRACTLRERQLLRLLRPGGRRSVSSMLQRLNATTCNRADRPPLAVEHGCRDRHVVDE